MGFSHIFIYDNNLSDSEPVENCIDSNIKDLLGNGTFCIDIAKYIENDANNPIIRIYVRELNEASTQRFMYNFVFNAIR